MEKQSNNNIPIENKFILTINEAVAYFNIGQKRLRELIKDEKCDFVLFNGKKALIKRNKLEEYINNTKYI